MYKYKFLPSSSLSGICSLILFQLSATGVNDTGGKFAAGVVDTGGNLPPASLTPTANLPSSSLSGICSLILFQLFATGGKFATGINNTRGTGGKICRRCR
jgi:hypothetical protein